MAFVTNDGEALRRYHEATKHSLESVQQGPRGLDWPNQPLPFRIYEGLEAEPLPKDFPPSGAFVADAVRGTVPPRAGVPTRADLAKLLFFSLGITKKKTPPGGGVQLFRAAPCTGALYHVDAWIVCGGLPDLEAGLWHFAPERFGLVRLRDGDFRPALASATGGEPAVREAPVTLVLASTWWRNAWKYRERAYRHVFWDGGTILAQLLAGAGADGWPARLVTGFADGEVERLLGLDREREGAIGLVPIGTGSPVRERSIEAPSLSAPTRTLSPREIAYPDITAAHVASSLPDGESARAWREASVSDSVTSVTGETTTLPASEASAGEPLEKAILRRGSSRRFSRTPITREELGSVLDAATAPLDADYRDEPDRSLVDLFLVVNAVEGVSEGAYRWHPSIRHLEVIRKGNLREEATFLDLGQPLGGDAAVSIYAIADLDGVFGTLGGRGYRAAQLDGGITGGRIYLGAYALGLGATGLTFFDDDVTRFFELDPKRWGVMFLTAVGHPAR